MWRNTRDPRCNDKFQAFGGVIKFLTILKKYGEEGILDIVTFDGNLLDLVSDTISMYLMIKEIAPYQRYDGYCLAQFTESLEPFFARVKLDNTADNESKPDFIEIAASICNDVLRVNGPNALIKIHSDFLTVRELSILWNMTEEAIRNEVLAKEDIRPQIKKFGLLLGVPAELAYELSKKRQGFKASRIQMLDKPYGKWVPVDASGEPFSTKCRNSKGYRIGRKGEEHLVEDYDTALEELVRMQPKPYWRRQNKMVIGELLRVFRG